MQQNNRKKLTTSFSIKKGAWVVYALTGLWLGINLWQGIADFLSTLYIYSLAALLLYVLSKKINLSKNLLLGLASVVLAFLMAEITLRFIVRYPLTYSEENGAGYNSIYKGAMQDNIWPKTVQRRPDVHTLQFDPGEIRDNNCGDYQYANDTCNALGFRGPLPPKNKKIILTLGDSFTEGAGAPADSSYPALLRNYITATDTNFDVLNAGISGNDIFFDWRMVQKLAPQYQLKKLIFLINSTDITDIMTRGGSERFLPNGYLAYKSGPVWEPLYAVSFVFRLFIHNALKLDYLFLNQQQAANARTQSAQLMTNLVKQQIVPWAKNKGIEVVLVLHPLNHEMGQQRKDYDLLLNAFDNIEGAKVLNCMPVLQATGNPESLYWPNDWHFKPQGYNLIAKYIFENESW